MEEGDVVCLQCGCAICDESGLTADTTPHSLSAPVQPTNYAAQVAVEPPSLSSPLFATETDLRGIGGWLIFTVIGLAVAPLLTAHGAYVDLRILYGNQYQAGLTARPALAGIVLFEAATNTILLATQIVLNVLFYRTRKIFPAWMIAFLAANFFVTLIDHLWVMRFSPGTSWSMVERTFVSALIWIPYFVRSRRVKLTFVN
jgi:hypothetical protein